MQLACLARLLEVGRGGLEPPTLGLIVRLDKLRRTASSRETLQILQFDTATN